MMLMAQDGKGRKFNRIPEHVREVNGKLVHVKSYIRSNRTDCKGKHDVLMIPVQMILKILALQL